MWKESGDIFIPQLDYRNRTHFHSTEILYIATTNSGVQGGGVFQTPPPPREIPKALQNRAKLNPIVKTVKTAELMTPTHQDNRKKGSKIFKVPRFAIFLH